MEVAVNLQELTPEIKKFIKRPNVTSQPTQPLTSSAEKVAPNVKQDDSPVTAAAKIERKPKVKPQPSEGKATLPKLELVNIYARIPSILYHQLSKAGVDRKSRGIEPNKQQEMFAEAAQEWLQKRGYWPDKG